MAFRGFQQLHIVASYFRVIKGPAGAGALDAGATREEVEKMQGNYGPIPDNS